MAVCLIVGVIGGAIGPSSTVAQSTPADPLVSVIVKLDAAPLATYSGDVAGLAATSAAVQGTRRLDTRSDAARAYESYLQQREEAFSAALGRVAPGARVLYPLRHVIGGVALVVPRSQVALLSSLPGVQAVYPGKLFKPLTDRSPAFVGAATELWWVVGGPAAAGEGVVVGVIDSGAWPEHPSFADPDPSGRRYPPSPATWKGTGCEFGSDVEGDAPFTCNNKLIAAQRIMASYDALHALEPAEFPSARDNTGHGTHTSTTAAGNRGVKAAIFGLPRGKVSGVAPRAHVAIYKACGIAGCEKADLIKAIEQAVEDGVDVINLSFGPESLTAPGPYDDPVALAFLDAYAAGVFVAVAAGNSGLSFASISAPANAPWVATVGASTSDRLFMSRQVRLRGSGGAVLTVTGASITSGLGWRSVVSARDFNNETCRAEFPAGTFQGQIVVCRDIGLSVQKSFNLARAGAGGMFLYNFELDPVFKRDDDVFANNHFLPTVHMDHGTGAALLAFLAAHPGVTGSFQAGMATGTTGDVMTYFSSRGSFDSRRLVTLKPDVVAPGHHILAGHTPRPPVEKGPPGQLFQAISGTSMAAPHVAGLAALLTQVRPDWTPGQIKSALMTTATQTVLKEDGATPATPFDAGAGRVDGRAWRAVLTLDASRQEFLDHRVDPWNINLPSLYHPALSEPLTVTRTVQSDLPVSSQWRVEATSPSGLSIGITPGNLTVPRRGRATFRITVDPSAAPAGVHFGAISLRRLLLGRPTGLTLHLPVAIQKP